MQMIVIAGCHLFRCLCLYKSMTKTAVNIQKDWIVKKHWMNSRQSSAGNISHVMLIDNPQIIILLLQSNWNRRNCLVVLERCFSWSITDVAIICLKLCIITNQRSFKTSFFIKVIEGIKHLWFTLNRKVLRNSFSSK